MIRVRRILCPVDFSAFSRHALDHATVLARAYEAELAVLHVTPLVPPLFTPPPGTNVATLRPFDAEAMGRELQAFVGDPASALPGIQLVLRSGGAAAAIVDYATETGADLVVMGTHGRTGFERLMLGSVTEKVLFKAPCPVLTVPRRDEGGAERPSFARIVCGVDFSPAARRAAEYALALGQEARGRLTLLHVVEWLPEEEFARFPQFDAAAYRGFVFTEARAQLDDLVPEEAQNWCEVDQRVTCGKPYREILRLAADEGADLVVLGVHGRGAVDRMLFGSTTQHVVRQASCPVLTVHP